ncbi:MAG: hypothetical protein HZB99_01360 [Candidatus Harrisonbacteria bacterium]|nr:hypothetical protein [Candidatus Harrisonbacteria bacterium]
MISEELPRRAPGEIANIEEQRKQTEKKLLEEGAIYETAGMGERVLILTKERIERIRQEMESGERALGRAKEIEDPSRRARYYSEIARAYRRPEALDLAIRSADMIEDPVDRSWALVQIAINAMEAGNFDVGRQANEKISDPEPHAAVLKAEVEIRKIKEQFRKGEQPRTFESPH